ncbi:MAG: HAD-IIB family hydrolase [Rhodospirillales bacterium]|nr:HAD-IIB family hydrolase [Rhodospirillales bacterium]
MRPLADIAPTTLAGLTGVFTDIDDTLTTDGYLTAEAYGAMERLQKAGLLVIPITGRPAGWCDHIARMWPVDAIVGENGAFWFRYDAKAQRFTKRFLENEATRLVNRDRLAAIGRDILVKVPGSALASDQQYREADIAIDWCEDVPRLPPEAVARIAALMEEAGLTAKVSSVHVNGWIGRYDKLSMTRILMREAFDIDLDSQKDRFAFLGDSPNDAPMFAYFSLGVGVANVCDFAGQMAHLPNFVAAGRGGAGFAEFAARALAARR